MKKLACIGLVFILTMLSFSTFAQKEKKPRQRPRQRKRRHSPNLLYAMRALLSKKDFNKIFEPGFTTKKRGWGLGLSLTKRIIEDFHNGKIKVLQSEKDKGSTIQISLKRAN